MLSPEDVRRQSKKAVHYPTMMVTGVAGSIAIMAAYKFWLKPGMVRRRRAEGELCADTLLGPLAGQAPPEAGVDSQ